MIYVLRMLLSVIVVHTMSAVVYWLAECVVVYIVVALCMHMLCAVALRVQALIAVVCVVDFVVARCCIVFCILVHLFFRIAYCVCVRVCFHAS